MSRPSVESIHRLTPLQEGILYHCLNAPGSPSYVVQFGGRYRKLDVPRFRAAWEHVVGQHPALRSLITWERRSKPLQVVRRRVTLPLHEEDWGDLPTTELDRRWRSFLGRDRAVPLTLDRAPLFRLALLRTGADEHRFLWTVHHVVVDGWSMQIVLDDVAEAYARLGRGDEPVASDAPTPADYVAWLDGRDPEADEAYWTRALGGGIDPLRLVDDPAADGHGHHDVAVALTPAVSAGLRETARARRLTVNTLVLGAWSLVLGRRAGATEAIVGTTVSGRSMAPAGTERAVGMFLNSLPLRIPLDPQSSLVDWLSGIQARQAELRAHEPTPLPQVQRCAGLVAGTPMFDAVVAFKNRSLLEHSRGEGPLPCLDPEVVDTSHYPLALVVTEAEVLTLHLVHDAARLSAAHVEALGEQLACVLEHLARDLDGRLGDVPLLSARQRELVTVTFNQTDTDLGEPRRLHELVRARAAAAPTAIALVDDDRSLSYETLVAQAVALAGRLRHAGVGSGVTVPLVMEREVQAIVGMLAVLEAGAAFVFIDPRWPRDRIAEALSLLAQEAPVPAILASATARASLPVGESAVLAADLDASPPAPDGPASAGTPADPAYVVFTSGSSGRPKGVRVSHASAFNSVGARAHAYPEAPGTFLLLSPLSADSALAGVLWTLCEGGTLVLPPRRAEQDPRDLWQRVRTQTVTHTLCLPSLYATLLEFAEPSSMASLRCIAVAGEACPRALVQAHEARLPEVALFNEYGPSEACVWASVSRLEAASESGRAVSIGRPIANTRLYVVDETLFPVPVDVPGELLIAGANLADGYVGDPQQTAARFPTLSMPGQPPRRVYRTGDRVCWRADGRLEFLGRVDRQVKIRGHRVELDEVEAALADAPGVAACAVVLAGPPPGAGSDALMAQLRALSPAQRDALLDEVEGLSEVELQVRLEARMDAGAAS